MAAVIGAEQNHFTAEDLRRKLPSSIGRATVYRTLKILVDWDILCRVHLSDGDLRYQLSHVGHHHPPHLRGLRLRARPHWLRHRGGAGGGVRPARASRLRATGWKFTDTAAECGSDERDPSRPDLVSTADSGDALSQ